MGIADFIYNGPFPRFWTDADWDKPEYLGNKLNLSRAKPLRLPGSSQAAAGRRAAAAAASTRRPGRAALLVQVTRRLHCPRSACPT